MDVYNILLQSGCITGAILCYMFFYKKPTPNRGPYREIRWYHPLKLWIARYAVSEWRKELKSTPLDELPRPGESGWSWNSFAVRTTDSDGTALLLNIRKLCRNQIAEIVVHVKLPDGTTYKLPQHPDTAVCAWQDVEGAWSADGLKIQVLEEQERYRFLYNGLLTRVEDGVTQHVKLNILWSSVTKPVRYPDDISDELAAEAIALVESSWREDLPDFTLSDAGESGWLQWGVAQGRFESFDEEGIVDRSVFLRTRGVKERRLADREYRGLRRSVNITAVAQDGTAVQLRCLSYKNELTHCISGCVRFPDYMTKAITSTDIVMSDFCERSDCLPDVYTINARADKSYLKLVLRINADGGELFSGVPYQHEVVYRTMHVDINCIPGTGILELGYEPSVVSEPTSRIIPSRVLKWLTEKEVGEVGYCVSFENRAAACPMYVGGKGASLALLASMQKDKGYRVPPGFCLTTKALEKHLDVNPHLLTAIRDIEDANANYNEVIFKELCKRASELFITTEIKGDYRDEILIQIKELRIKATEENLGSEAELRFAVRSSAVGEDSEELSAAGQNETVLGCVSDSDIIEGVQKCWASMFAFTSTYYRRQNGQPCLCGGGVVVQALVTPRAAGVMFTRHPAHGDPSRLLITANYGLGESVVSGTVEPDTIILKRTRDGQLTISKKELGSKSHRVKAEGSGIATEDVPEEERNVACITDEEALKLASIGVSQEELWGAGRDIEWAVKENEIFLLQARPITSLDRWTEEELLFELDSPIMADDEITSFGNCGEILPKPLTPMTYDMNSPLDTGMSKVVGINGSGYDKTTVLTHYRCAIALYNTLYKRAPKELGVTVRMMEMAIHGHFVADEQILKTAQHRRPPCWRDQLEGICLMTKALALSKRAVDDSVKASAVSYDIENDNPEELFEALLESQEIMERVGYNHAFTSTASTSSQLVAMLIFLEGKSEFTPEQCSEISSMFSSGDVLSAKVPMALANIVQKLEKSGLAEEFRAQDPKTALKWLKENAHDDIYVDVRQFLEEHGYRAVMEFDLVTKPWVLVPENMMTVLQNLHVTTEGIKETKSCRETVDSLKTPEKPYTRTILRWILPLCHRMVRHRESTKAHLVLVIHKLRIGFIRLGNMLVKKWYIPNPELVFFFRKLELKKYLATRDPALLRKAMQRQQYHPGWCKLKFAELNTGWVNKLEPKAPNLLAGDVKISAMSVCGGEVVARACVIKDLESEIGDLRRGDILITHATDIGWSPYFPLLTGIVTELGGLISHGAVIAREYGLPCIVGAAHATDVFKTGDLVRLSGSKGVIEKVEVNEDQEDDSIES